MRGPFSSMEFAVLLPAGADWEAYRRQALSGAEAAVELLNQEGGAGGAKFSLFARAIEWRDSELGPLWKELGDRRQTVAVIAYEGLLHARDFLSGANATQLAIVAPWGRPDPSWDKRVWSLRHAPEHEGRALARLADSLKARRAGIVREDEEEARRAAEGFRQEFMQEGREIGEEVLRVSDAEAAAAARRLVEHSPDVIFTALRGGATGKFVRAAREAGVQSPIMSYGVEDGGEFFGEAGGLVTDVYVASPFTFDKAEAKTEAFLQALRQRNGALPSFTSALFFEAVVLAAEAVRYAPSADQHTVAEALARLERFPGLGGSVVLLKEGGVRRPLEILRAENGKFVYLETVSP